jgi:histidinol-phosphatase (PHP family)
MSSWKDHEPLEIWTLYFERLAMAAQSGLFDIIGHADLCKKFCFYPKEDCAPLYARFLEAAARAGVAMELNTAGLRKDCREIYPCRRLVQMAAEARVPITFGSDAHAPEEVGLDFARAVQAALDAGHTHYCRFTGRRRQVTRIDDPHGRG